MPQSPSPFPSLLASRWLTSIEGPKGQEYDPAYYDRQYIYFSVGGSSGLYMLKILDDAEMMCQNFQLNLVGVLCWDSSGQVNVLIDPFALLSM